MSLADEMRNLTNTSNNTDDEFTKLVNLSKDIIKNAAMEGKNYITFASLWQKGNRDYKDKLEDWLKHNGFSVKTAVDLGWRRYGQDSCLTKYVLW